VFAVPGRRGSRPGTPSFPSLHRHGPWLSDSSRPRISRSVLDGSGFVTTFDNGAGTPADGVDALVHNDTLGGRWNLLPWNALKVEYAFANNKGFDDEHEAAVNLAF
jgi:hypothetical protein